MSKVQCSKGGRIIDASACPKTPEFGDHSIEDTHPACDNCVGPVVAPTSVYIVISSNGWFTSQIFNDFNNAVRFYGLWLDMAKKKRGSFGIRMVESFSDGNEREIMSWGYSDDLCRKENETIPKDRKTVPHCSTCRCPAERFVVKYDGDTVFVSDNLKEAMQWFGNVVCGAYAITGRFASHKWQLVDISNNFIVVESHSMTR